MCDANEIITKLIEENPSFSRLFDDNVTIDEPELKEMEEYFANTYGGQWGTLKQFVREHRPNNATYKEDDDPCNQAGVFDPVRQTFLNRNQPQQRFIEPRIVSRMTKPKFDIMDFLNKQLRNQTCRELCFQSYVDCDDYGDDCGILTRQCILNIAKIALTLNRSDVLKYRIMHVEGVKRR